MQAHLLAISALGWLLLCKHGRSAVAYLTTLAHRRGVRSLSSESWELAADHVANSPELNPIELVWARMAHMVNSNVPWGENISLTRFKEEIERAWIACAGPGTFIKDMEQVRVELEVVFTAVGKAQLV